MKDLDIIAADELRRLRRNRESRLRRHHKRMDALAFEAVHMKKEINELSLELKRRDK